MRRLKSYIENVIIQRIEHPFLTYTMSIQPQSPFLDQCLPSFSSSLPSRNITSGKGVQAGAPTNKLRATGQGGVLEDEPSGDLTTQNLLPLDFSST